MLKDYLTKICLLTMLMGLAFGGFAQNLTITAPASIAGNYPITPAIFGPTFPVFSGEIVYADDGLVSDNDMNGTFGTIHDGCDPIMNDVNGKIALIDRGECGFTVKAIEAQNAGAIAVIICNNNVNYPNATQPMAGDDMGVLTIPSAMVSFNTCAIIKQALADGPVTVSTVLPVAGEICEMSIPAVEGVNTAPTLTGGGSLITSSASAIFYTFTPTTDALMTVSSCGDTVDTRLYILGDGCDVLTIFGTNDDLDFDNGLYCSETTVVVTAGTEYIIYWDDVWTNVGFEWTLTLSAIPNVDVTFSVDMKNETVATDGVKISINGGAEADMNDDGNGIWSYTAALPAGSDYSYVFLNGSGNAEDNPDIVDCRTVSVGLDPVDVGLVCYNSCLSCPPDTVCPLWIDENFDGYTLGGISAQSPIWTPWAPPVVPAADANVSDEQSFGGSQSLKIDEASMDDQLLLLGNRNSGNYVMKWKMYIPTGSAGYYNIQKDQNTPGSTGNTGLQVDFLADGTGNIDAGAENNFTFSYPQNTWFEVYHFVDLDNDLIRMWVNGVSVNEWPASWESFAQTGLKQIGAIDFFGNTGNLYYVDDVILKQIDACPADAIICDGFDGYDAGGLDKQSPWWGTWTPNDATQDGLVMSEEYLSCEQALKISEAGGDDQILLLGERTSGNYSFGWDMFVPAGSAGYYNIQKKVTAATSNADFAFAATFGTNGTATVDVGTTAAWTFAYPQDEWFNVTHTYDLDNNLAVLYINGQEINSWAADLTAIQGSGLKKFGGIDFFGDVDVLYYVDNVLFQKLPSVPGNVCDGAIDLDSYLGQGMGTVTSTPLFDNTNYTTTASDPATGYECFGEPDGLGGLPSLEQTIWYTFTGDGETYLIETAQCGSTNYIDDGDTQLAIYTGTCGSLVPAACNEDGPSATATEFPAGIEFATTAGTVYYMMIDGFNFQGAISDGEYCIKFTQMTGAIPTVPITFQVDMTWEIEQGMPVVGVKIAGNFTTNGASVPDWAPPMSPVFTSVGNDVWQTTIDFPVTSVGQTLEYKFLNTTDTWGDCGDEQECFGADSGTCTTGIAPDYNRALVIPATATTLCYTYNTCSACNLPNATTEIVEIPMTIAPNPFSNKAIVTFNTPIVNGEARLTTLTGQSVRNYRVEGNQLTILKNEMVPGIYFLNVVTENGISAAEKLIVQ